MDMSISDAHGPLGKGRGDEMDNMADEMSKKSRQRKVANEAIVKVAMSLYKVQQNIYLLDFQRIEVTSLLFI